MVYKKLVQYALLRWAPALRPVALKPRAAAGRSTRRPSDVSRCRLKPTASEPFVRTHLDTSQDADNTLGGQAAQPRAVGIPGRATRPATHAGDLALRCHHFRRTYRIMPHTTAHELDEHAAHSIREAILTVKRAFAEGLASVGDLPRTEQVTSLRTGLQDWPARQPACRQQPAGNKQGRALAGTPLPLHSLHCKHASRPTLAGGQGAC